jgi:Holliday junction resolvase RusA-like endonuclease
MILLDTVLEGLPPALNHAYTPTARGPRLTAGARAWQEGAALALRAAVRHPASDRRARLVVRVTLTSPRPLSFDVDGRLKLILDALSTALGVDDRYVMSLAVTKARGAPASTRVQVVEEAV